MKIKRVERQVIRNGASSAKTTTHHNCQLSIDKNSVLLSGAQFGHIADGFVKATDTAYQGADYQVSFQIMVQTSRTRGAYRLERWFVTF